MFKEFAFFLLLLGLAYSVEDTKYLSQGRKVDVDGNLVYGRFTEIAKCSIDTNEMVKCTADSFTTVDCETGKETIINCDLEACECNSEIPDGALVLTSYNDNCSEKDVYNSVFVIDACISYNSNYKMAYKDIGGTYFVATFKDSECLETQSIQEIPLEKCYTDNGDNLKAYIKVNDNDITSGSFATGVSIWLVILAMSLLS